MGVRLCAERFVQRTLPNMSFDGQPSAAHAMTSIVHNCVGLTTCVAQCDKDRPIAMVRNSAGDRYCDRLPELRGVSIAFPRRSGLCASYVTSLPEEQRVALRK